MTLPLLKIQKMQRSTIDTHWVVIADEAGMASVFPKLKSKLSEARLTAITILYHARSKPFAFSKELAMLEWHFPARLYVIYELLIAGEDIVNQASIESVINANTIPAISFAISGIPAFTEQVKSILIFLGVKDISVQEQFFSCL